MPIVIRDESGGVVGGNVANPAPMRSHQAHTLTLKLPGMPSFGKLGHFSFLFVGIAALVLLSKLSLSGELGQSHAQAPKPIEGYELNSNHPPVGRVTLRGEVQYIKKAKTQGVILEMRAEDGTPFTAFAGPDVVLPSLRSRDRIALTGKLQTDLFLVTDARREKALSEKVTYYVAHTKDGWAYVQDGGEIRKFPLPANFNGQTITVSYFGKRIIVER